MGTPVNKLKQMEDKSSEVVGDELFEQTMKELGQDGGSEDCSVPSSETLSSNQNPNPNVNAMNSNVAKDSDILSSIEANEQAEKMVEQLLNSSKTKKTTLQKVVDDFREPLLVVILFIIFNTGFFSNLLVKYLPKFLANATGSLNYTGIAIHSTLFGLVFYVLKKLLS